MTADNPQFNTGAKIPRRLFLTGAGLAGASYLLNQALRLPENDSGTSSKSSLTQSETDLGVWSNSIDEVTNQMGKVESDVFFSPNAESNFLGVDYYRIINRK